MFVCGNLEHAGWNGIEVNISGYNLLVLSVFRYKIMVNCYGSRYCMCAHYKFTLYFITESCFAIQPYASPKALDLQKTSLHEPTLKLIPKKLAIHSCKLAEIQ